MNTPKALRGFKHLADELETYYTHKAELLETARGKQVLIKGTRIVGTYDSVKEAYAEGLRQFRLTGFFIREIHEGEPVVYVGGGGPPFVEL